MLNVFKVVGGIAVVGLVIGMVERAVFGDYPEYYYPALIVLWICIGVGAILRKLDEVGKSQGKN